MPSTHMETASAWSRALRDPSLRDLPYKIETNEYGQLVMSPLRPLHSYFQVRLTDLLRDHVDEPGRRLVGFAIETSEGVKVPDVAWISEERWTESAVHAEASAVAAEICIEVLSKSNTMAEFREKRTIYFDHGALEVWTCDMEGSIRFFDPSGERSTSGLVPSFPKHIGL